MSLSRKFDYGENHHYDRNVVKLGKVCLKDLSMERINKAISRIRVTGQDLKYLIVLENEITHRAVIANSPLGKALS